MAGRGARGGSIFFPLKISKNHHITKKHEFRKKTFLEGWCSTFFFPLPPQIIPRGG